MSRRVIGIICISLFLLFYPGNSPLLELISFHKDLLVKEVVENTPSIQPVPIAPANGPAISAGGSYIADLDSFTPVYERNAQGRFFPASTTKIVTALVAEDVFHPDDTITVKRVIDEGQVMGLVQNEQISVENLLYGILVHSGNDAAYALADAYGFDKFMVLMNEKAKSIGMKSSNFKNPAGLDDSNQYSSPYDLALAGRAVLHNKQLKKMVGTKEIIISDTNYRIFHKLTNVNQLLGEIAGIGGLKTGYTESAGENLVSFYKRADGKEFIIVVLKSEDRFEDTRAIVDWLQRIQYADVTI